MADRHPPWKAARWFAAFGLLLVGVLLLGNYLHAPALPPQLPEATALVAAKLPGRAYLEGYDRSFANRDQVAMLPLGPDLKTLPGSITIWRHLLSPKAESDRSQQRVGFDGIQIWDEPLTTQRQPVVSVPLPGRPYDLCAQADRAFVLLTNGRWLLVDFADWHRPEIFNLTPAGGYVRSMAVRGTRAWLLLNNDELLVLDIDKPRQPRELLRMRLPDHAATLAIQGDHLLVHVQTNSIGSRQLYVYRLGKGDAPVPLGAALLPSYRTGTLWAEGRLFLPRLEGGIDVYDLSEPLQPRLAATIELDDLVERMTLREGKLLLLGVRNRIYEVDLASPGLRPRELAHSLGRVAMLLIDRAYLAAFTSDHYLEIFARTGLARRLKASPDARDYPAGGLLSGGAGMRPLLLVEPDAIGAGNPPEQGPVSLLPLREGLPVLDAARMDDDLLVLRAGGRLQQYPDRPGVETGQPRELQLDIGLRWLTVDRDWVYLGGGDHITVLQRDPAGRLEILGEFALGGRESWMATLFEGRLCVAAGRDGLLVYSLAVPGRPQRLPDWVMPRALGGRLDVRGLAAADRTLYVAAGGAGLLLASWSGSERLELSGVMNTPDPARAVALLGDFRLVATDQQVLAFAQVDRRSLQQLGAIEMTGAERLSPIGEQWWGGLVPGQGWRCLPVPRMAAVVPERSSERVRLEFIPPAEPWNFQAVLFNPQGVANVTEPLELAAAVPAAGGLSR